MLLGLGAVVGEGVGEGGGRGGVRVWGVVGLLGGCALAEEFYQGGALVLCEEAEGRAHGWGVWVLFAGVEEGWEVAVGSCCTFGADRTRSMKTFSTVERVRSSAARLSLVGC